MAYNNFYKIYQAESKLITKHNFNEILLKKYQAYFEQESWLTNYNDPNYQVIRISFFDTNFTAEDNSRINTYLNYFRKDSGKDIKFLDIHINKKEYNEADEIYDHINIEENYYAGIDLKDIYPSLYDCIHESSNPEMEMKKQFDNIQSKVKEKKRQLPLLVRSKYLFTYITMGICVLMFLVENILALKIDTTSAFLLLGADYKLLTLGCNEFYRLFTYAFLHSGFAHIFCNLVSIFSLGRIIEQKYGHWNYLIILFTSIVCGSLTQGILSDNELCIGLSGGIYGLFVAYIIDTARNGIDDLRRLIPVVLLNIMLNFMTSTAWMCHLGGAIAGIATYYAVSEEKNYGGIALVVILVLCLIFKYVTIDSINIFYGGTDSAYVNALNSLNFDTTKLVEKILNAYTKFGG